MEIKVKYFSTISIIYILALGTLSSVVRASDSQTPSSSNTQNQSRYVQQLAEYDRQQAQTKKQLDDYAQMLTNSQKNLELEEQLRVRAEKQQDAYERILDREQKLIEKQEEQTQRFEVILNTWGTQQKQYQSYLDSLTKK
jgi:hypothetical protein